jgi:endonuclease/exonuclease/phosphatase family metal-dependent hydrolase
LIQPARLGAALLALAVAAGCARALSYLDPAGPLYRHTVEPPAGGPAPAATAPLRVVSFNVQHALRITEALDAIAGSPALRDADVLALQEMDAPGVERIARALGMSSVFFPSGVHPAYHRDFGCAVLSRWPLVDPRKLVLPHGARISGLRRAVASAVVVRGALRVRVYSVHLPSPRAVSGGSRREQMRVLAADAATFAGPVVIAGDFNSDDVGRELVAAGFAWPTRGSRPTTADGHAYDHVFLRGLSASAAGVEPDNRQASDHKPVWTLLTSETAPVPGGHP